MRQNRTASENRVNLIRHTQCLLDPCRPPKEEMHMRFRSSVRMRGTLTAFFSIVFLFRSGSAFAENRDSTIARCGAGFVESIGGYRDLHLKGSPYAMGFQHGTLLKDDIRELVRFLFEEKAKEADFKLFGQKNRTQGDHQSDRQGRESVRLEKSEKIFCTVLTTLFRYLYSLLIF